VLIALFKKQPDTSDITRLIWPTVLALRALGGSGANREIDQQVIAQEGLTEEQQLVGSHVEIAG